MTWFTLNNENSTTRDLSVFLTGTRDPAVSRIYVNGSSVLVEKPTQDTWQAEILLTPGANLLVITSPDAGGRYEVTITLTHNDPDVGVTWNAVDEWAVPFGITRLPGERNRQLRLRILDVMQNPGGSAYGGLINAVNRDLGFTVVSPGVTVTANFDEGLFIGAPVWLTLTPLGYKVTAKDIIQREIVQVDRSTREFPLSLELFDADTLRVFDLEGQQVKDEWVEYDEERNRVTLTRERADLADKCVNVEYQYTVTIPTENKTVAEVVASLEALLNTEGQPYLKVFTFVDDSYSATKLTYIPQTEMDRTGVQSTWAPVSLRELIDDKWRESMYVDGHAYGTVIEAWHARIKTFARLGWGDTILDDDGWELDTVGTVLPHIYDPRYVYWESSDPLDDTKYDIKDYLWYGGRVPGKPRLELKPKGVLQQHWKSGVGSTNDLLMLDLTEIT